MTIRVPTEQEIDAVLEDYGRVLGVSPAVVEAMRRHTKQHWDLVRWIERAGTLDPTPESRQAAKALMGISTHTDTTPDGDPR